MAAELGPIVPVRWPQSLIDGTEMGRRIHDFDWAATPLGPLESWPQCLRNYVGLIVPNSCAMYIFWGADYHAIYNDAYAPIAGRKHPSTLGLPCRVAWPEAAETLMPLVDDVFHSGRGVTLVDQHFPIYRFGYLEEFYCKITYSPLRDEDGAIVAVLSTCVESTDTVIGQRRIETLRDLAARTTHTTSETETLVNIGDTLSSNADLPFALLYLRDGPARARLAACVGVTRGATEAPESVALEEPPAPWPLGEALAAGRMSIVNLQQHGLQGLPGGPWPESPHTALIVPMGSARGEAIGALIVGTSPRLRLDKHYREFVSLAANQIANAISGARAYENERNRADALVELDREKTAFFSNVSHEFRTPLTLMLGPLEGLLSRSDGVSDDVRSELSLVHRNAGRLQKLVNSLLDFSRVEAGRLRPQRVAADLAALTASLASEFAPVIEAAGLRYLVDIDPARREVSIDPEMWSTIVLNLLSNAFKFTFEGDVRVTLRETESSFELRVGDTGTGIAAAELPRVFERFRRVATARARTHEGSGIGLALVDELARALDGEVRVESALGIGTTFTVAIPKNAVPDAEMASLPAARSASKQAVAYVAEAAHWDAPTACAAAPPNPSHAPPARGAAALAERPCIVLCDDNADMRAYIGRLLAAQFRVIAVADGAAGLAAARAASPDLVLTDVMMPVLDGFGLLRAIREDPGLRTVPVVMLSARSDEGAAVEGLDDGADDYVVKPFGARELIARITSNITLARLRRDYERERRVADLFARASLPRVLPHVPGLHFDAVYMPGAGERVGGDWYDAVRLLDGRVVISIGDVAGSGLEAALVMGTIRQTIRGIAQVHADPVLMLDAADRALRLENHDLFVTAFVGVLDPIERTLTYASAGHPPPCVLSPGGDVRQLAERGLPLGLRFGDWESAAATLALEDGALLVLYTDGLTEATHNVVEGERRLTAALQNPGVASAARPAAAVRDAVLAGTAGADDVAILTVRFAAVAAAPSGAEPPRQLWTFAATDAAAANLARRALGAALRSRGASVDDVYDAEMVVGELIGNVVRYAPGDAEVIVDWSGPLPVLHVLDRGRGFRHIALLPDDPLSETGRGLFLVATLTEDFNVRKRHSGGSHACAVLSLERTRLATTVHGSDSGILLDALERSS